MEASPLPYYYQKLVVPPHRRQPQPPQFGGGPGDVFANVAGWVDASRFRDLVTTDLCGMVVPRSGLAYNQRGPDDARETFLREMSGLIGNTFLVGWVSYAIVKGLGNGVNAYNPLGIPGKAWVSSENLEIFDNLYQNSLKQAKTVGDARKQFIHQVLEGLESGDRQFSIESRIASLQKLPKEAKEQVLVQMVDTIGDLDNLKAYQQLLEQPEALRKKFEDNGWGRLSAKSREDLYEYFVQREEMKGSVKGSHNFDQLAAQRVKEMLPPHATRAEKRKAFIQARLAFSLDDLRNNAQQFEKAINQEALARGLTGTVHLRDATGQKFLSQNQNRGAFLKQLKFFLEQFVDRATYQAAKKVGPASTDTEHKQLKAEILKLLNNESEQGLPLLKKVIPQAEDGLITAAKKSKFAFTWIPMTVALLASGAFAFYNNYLTKKKYGGKVFFPGEGVPPPESNPAKPLPSGSEGNHFAASRLMQPTFRNSAVMGYSAYAPQPYAQVRRSPGGIMA